MSNRTKPTALHWFLLVLMLISLGLMFVSFVLYVDRRPNLPIMILSNALFLSASYALTYLLRR